MKNDYTRSKNVQWDIPLTSEGLVCGPAEEETQEYDVGCFQSVCAFFLILHSKCNIYKQNKLRYLAKVYDKKILSEHLRRKQDKLITINFLSDYTSLPSAALGYGYQTISPNDLCQ